jgi:hypothetical protein
VKIPKDKLIRIISHFSVGRKSTDSKNDMVHNLVEHFRKLLNPKLCSGGCGYKLQEDFSYCKPCLEKKNKPRAVTVMFNFDDNLDEIVENLTEITLEIFDKYNREQYYKIAAKLGLKIKQKTKKEAVVDMINNTLKNKEEEKQKKLIEYSKKQEEKYTLTFNGMDIQYRKEDGFVNATAMCKAGKKKFNDWNRLDSTKELIKALESEVGSPVSGNPVSVIDIKKGGNDKYSQGSWIHPDLSVQLAQWISPKFALQVSKWIRELAVTGSVINGMEKNNEQILSLQNALVEQQKEIEILEKKHTKILYKRQYHKFNKGPAFYIVKISENEFKLGFEGVDIDERFRTYRTLVPHIKIYYIVYSEKAHLIEQSMLTRFNSKKWKIIMKLLLIPNYNN